VTRISHTVLVSTVSKDYKYAIINYEADLKRYLRARDIAIWICEVVGFFLFVLKA